MSATDTLRLAENNALRINQAPQLAFELAGAGGYGNVGLGSGDDFVEHDSFLSNSGKGFYKGKNDSGGFSGAGKFSLKLDKKKATKIIAGIVLGILVGGGLFLANSNTLLFTALGSLFTSSSNLQETSLGVRGRIITKFALGQNKSNTFVKKYQLTPSLIKKFSSNGISVESTSNGTELKFGNKTVTKSNFNEIYNTDVEFRDAYSKSRRNRALSFFDTTASKVYQGIMFLSRNFFDGFKRSDDPETNLKNYNETINKSVASDSVEIYNGGNKETTVDEVDEDTGEVTQKTVTEFDSESTKETTGKDISTADATSKANSYISGIANKLSTASALGNSICTVLKVATLISVSISAVNTMQAIRTGMARMESASKAVAGYGEESGVHEDMQYLSESATVEISDLNNIKTSKDSEGNIQTSAETAQVAGAPIQAEGMQFILSDLTPNQTKLNNYSFEKAGTAFLRTLSLSGVSVAGCAVNSIIGGVASLAVSISGGAVSIVGSFLAKTIYGFAKSLVLLGLIAFIVPTLTEMFKNPVNIIGIPGGELMASGILAATGTLSKNANASMPTDSTGLAMYNRENDIRLAQEAELDRLNRSPFDITNQNTFFGSIAYSLLPLITAVGTNNSLSGVTTITNTTSKAVASLTGSAYASGSGSNSYMQTYGDCPALESIGAHGDIYCNPIVVSDGSTLYLEPDDPTYVAVIQNATEEGANGELTIKKDSNFAKFISYCVDRTSPYGNLDSNILSDLSKTSNLGSAGTIAGAMPIIGDIMGIIDAVSDLDEDHQAWADGSMCVNKPDNELWQKELKYYQRYLEDMRVLEQMGDSSATVAINSYREEYAAEHPIENSTAGILSRISGITLDDAETVIALVEYYDFIKDYDPSSRIAMEGGVEKTSTDVIEEAKNQQNWQYEDTNIDHTIEKVVLANHDIVYADIRNRNYAV